MEATISKKELYNLRKDLRNKTKLHEQARARVKNLEEKVKAQKQEIAELQEARVHDHALILELKRQLEELRAKIFKKRTHTNDEEEPEDTATQRKDTKAQKHTRRPIPKEETITKKQHHRLSDTRCTQCNNTLTTYQTVDYYREDIVLPYQKQVKTVEKTSIERGWCHTCRAWRHAKPPPSAQVMLGPMIRAYVCYLSILLRLSYEQIRTHLAISHRIDISDGEISYILEKEAILLRPDYEALNIRINQQRGIHEDETPWSVQKEGRGNYAWVKTGTDTHDVVFRFGESRGAGVARELTADYGGVGITDDYALYHGMFGEHHQLCFAHPHRKLRDLAYSQVFDDATKKHCTEAYESFSKIYSKVRDTLALTWDAERNKRVRKKLLRQLQAWAQPHTVDPLALQRIKARTREVGEKYFTCLLHEGIPADNNKAERALRHMVIKRRTSFGSKTQKGADVLSVLASVILSLWWTNPASFWHDYLALRG